jgi:hypothetical protein
MRETAPRAKEQAQPAAQIFIAEDICRPLDARTM